MYSWFAKSKVVGSNPKNTISVAENGKLKRWEKTRIPDNFWECGFYAAKNLDIYYTDTTIGQEHQAASQLILIYDILIY